MTLTQSELFFTKKLGFSIIHFIIERNLLLFFFFCIKPDVDLVIVCPFEFVGFAETLFFFNVIRITQQ